MVQGLLWDSTAESTDTLPKLIDVLTNRFWGTKKTDKYRTNSDIESAIQAKPLLTYITILVG